MVNTLLKSPELITKQLIDRFKEEIASGRFAENEALPSYGTLADTYGISKSTVHEAFKILARDGYLFIKHGKGAFVNINKIDRKKNVQLRDVAVLAFNIFSANDNTMVPFLEAVNSSALSKKISLHFHLIQGFSIQEPGNSLVREAVAENRYDGLIIASPINPSDLEWLCALKIPFVAATSRYDLDIPQVMPDNGHAVDLAAQIFASRGVRSITVFTGPVSWERKGVTPYAREVVEAFGRYQDRFKVKFVYCEYNYLQAKEQGAKSVESVMAADALFFQADVIAKGVMAGLSEKGVSLEGKTLVNYCDLEDYLVPNNIRKPHREMGLQAFNLLESVIKNEPGKRQLIISPEIILKEQTHG